MKKRIFTLLFCLILLIQISQLIYATESSFEWSFQPGINGITINDPQSSVTIDYESGFPLYAMTIDETLLTGKADYTDDEMSFNLKVTPETEDISNFLALFSFRNNSPGDPCWAPGVNAITLEIYKEQIILTGKRNGNAINESIALAKNVADGSVHTFKIEIDDENKSVKITIDNSEEISLVFSRLSSFGGYQIYGYNANVEMTAFKASDSRAVATSTPAPSPTTAPTPTNTANPTTPPESSGNESSDTVSETDATPTPDAGSEDSSVTESEESSNSENTSSKTVSEESSEEISNSVESTPADDTNDSDSADDSGIPQVLIIVLGSVAIIGAAAAIGYFFIFKKK